VESVELGDDRLVDAVVVSLWRDVDGQHAAGRRLAGLRHERLAGIV
jgi:hypothetical protein